MADRADIHLIPDGELVSIDLTAADGEGTVCLDNEAQWYVDQKLTTKPAEGEVLSLDDVYGEGADL